MPRVRQGVHKGNWLAQGAYRREVPRRTQHARTESVIDETAQRLLAAALIGRGQLVDDVLQRRSMHQRHRLIAMFFGKLGQDAPSVWYPGWPWRDHWQIHRIADK